MSIKFLCVTLSRMSISPRIVISITFQQVDCAPNAEASAQRHNEDLKNANSRIKESHK